jgi:hypothetical protein
MEARRRAKFHLQDRLQPHEIAIVHVVCAAGSDPTFIVHVPGLDRINGGA